MKDRWEEAELNKVEKLTCGPALANGAIPQYNAGECVGYFKMEGMAGFHNQVTAQLCSFPVVMNPGR